MRLIRDVYVRNLRSLRRARVEELDKYVPLVGLNGSGKSNVLRALQLFFSGTHLDPSTTFTFRRDHWNPGRRFGGKREVAVAVTFDLQSGYGPRAEVEAFFKAIGATSEITIERAWAFSDPSARAVTEELLAGTDPTALDSIPVEHLSAARTFLNSITFRYVPNHVEPSELLSKELQTLRRALLKRVRARAAYRTGGVAAAMEDLQQVATQMFAPMSANVVRHTPELSGVAPDLPSDFADLAFNFGINAVSSSGVTQSPELQGSGTQSFMLLHVLDLIDQAEFGVSFGWTKAVIWALEEPESFLHAGLRSQFAEDVVRMADDSRRQVFVTTHQDDFIRTGDHAWLVKISGSTSSIARLESREAVVQSARERISTFQHPLLLHPNRPLVIVEGVSDASYLRRAIVEADLKPRWVLVHMGELDEDQSGGAAVRNYLATNTAALRARSPASPVFVVRDWEDSDSDIAKIQTVLDPHGYSKALRLPEGLANPELGQKVRGIERFLPTSVIKAVLKDKLQPASLSSTYPLRVDKPDLDAAKARLAQRMGAQTTVGPNLVSAVQWINQEVEKSIAAVPAEFFLEGV